jgi:hypothetical protein
MTPDHSGASRRSASLPDEGTANTRLLSVTRPLLGRYEILDMGRNVRLDRSRRRAHNTLVSRRVLPTHRRSHRVKPAVKGCCRGPAVVRTENR